MFTKKALSAAPSAPKVYVEDVFSTYLYTGNGSTQTITNGIDLAGEGGLVWFKARSAAYSSQLADTARGVGKVLFSDLTSAESTYNTVSSVSSSGFTIDGSVYGGTNGNGVTFASWTFRKAAKFFDVVTYTGNGSNRTIAHNLGSVPGAIIVKRTDEVTNWMVYHRNLTSASYTLYLNDTSGEVLNTAAWNATSPTSSALSLGTDVKVNASGGTYVAYLFAHDAGGFGDAGDQSVVSCGSYSGNGSATGPTVTLGWEPQWLLIKRTNSTGDWQLIDNMRGFVVGGTDAELNPNLSNAESTGTFVTPTSTGFQLNTTNAGYNASGSTYIYIAIRRGPMKTPTSGTEVFSAQLGNNSGTPEYTAGFPVDMAIAKSQAGSSTDVAPRLTQGAYLQASNTNAEATSALYNFAFQDGYFSGSSNWFSWMFRRAPGFFDVVAYTGTGSARTVNHNLGVAPELMIVKRRSATDAWQVYAGSGSEYLVLNTDAAKVTGNSNRWNSTAPTSTVFSLGTDSTVNASAATYIAYLFATLPGVSKVFTFTGNGGSQTINCGFTAGARFVLIKRTDSTGNWLVADTARGIVSGNDPLLYLNSTAAEITNLDWLDPDSSGFIVNETATANANVNGATYIGLAIA
jgi:hypothetical protein